MSSPFHPGAGPVYFAGYVYAISIARSPNPPDGRHSTRLGPIGPSAQVHLDPGAKSALPGNQKRLDKVIG
jgi:hypothetical protein